LLCINIDHISYLDDYNYPEKNALRMPFNITAWTFSCQWQMQISQKKHSKHQKNIKQNGQEKQRNVITTI